jgi:hypothetical protein
VFSSTHKRKWPLGQHDRIRGARKVGHWSGGALAKALPHLDIEIVKRSDRVSGFGTLPKSWTVERTNAWLNRCQRLAKDWENLNRKRSFFGSAASMKAITALTLISETPPYGMREAFSKRLSAGPHQRLRRHPAGKASRNR